MPARRALVAVVGTFLVLPGSAAAAAGDASVSQTGSWELQEGAADPVVGPLVPQVPALLVGGPDDSLRIGALLGEPRAVTAVGLDLSGGDGSYDRLVLTVRPTGGMLPGVAVVACPITGPWGPSTRGDWVNRPDADCAAGQAPGVDGGDGALAFDLTQLVSLGVVTPDGVLLVEAVEQPTTFELVIPADAVSVDAVAGAATPSFGGDDTVVQRSSPGFRSPPTAVDGGQAAGAPPASSGTGSAAVALSPVAARGPDLWGGLSVLMLLGAAAAVAAALLAAAALGRPLMAGSDG